MESLLANERPGESLRDAGKRAQALAWHIAWFCLWLFPNPLLRVAFRDVYTPSGIFNLDLLICGAIALYLPAIWSPVLLTLAMTVDVVEGLVRTWFFSPRDILVAARFLPSLPAGRLCGYALLILVTFGGISSLAWWVRRHTVGRARLGTALSLLLLGFLCLGVDMTWGGRGLAVSRDAQASFFLARVPERTLYRQISAVYTIASHPTASLQMDSASLHLIRTLPDLSTEPRLDIVQVLVESWGIDRSGTFDRRLLDLYDTPEIGRRYRIVTGTVPFVGATVFGETRELCNSTLGFGVLRASSSALLRNCLPRKLRALGYRTEAVHGYFAGMYGRYLWYPRMGFDDVFFKRRLHSEGLTDCQDAFPGICDDQAAAWIGNHLANSKGPIFLHWVTLNSHLPVPSRLSGLNPAPCDFDRLVRQSEPLCAWFKLEYQVHSSIASLISRTDLRPTAFVVVGDHAPPFASPVLRNRFVSDRVPFVIFIPLQFTGGTSSTTLAAGMHTHNEGARASWAHSSTKTSGRHRHQGNIPSAGDHSSQTAGND